MPRVRELTQNEIPAEFGARLKEIFGEGGLKNGTLTGTPGNWWTIWARVPGILKAFSAYSYREASIDPKLRELALIRTGYVKASQFVFSQHCKGGRRAGLSDEKIEAVPYWSISNVFSDAERAVLAYVDAQMLEDGRVHDRLFAALKAHLSEEEILILTYFINMYALHAVSGRALRLEYDDVPERVVEVPAPATRKIQDWLSTSWARGG
jgi:alkylhydroperoxidase family enzyme